MAVLRPRVPTPTMTRTDPIIERAADKARRCAEHAFSTLLPEAREELNAPAAAVIAIAFVDGLDPRQPLQRQLDDIARRARGSNPEINEPLVRSQEAGTRFVASLESALAASQPQHVLELLSSQVWPCAATATTRLELETRLIPLLSHGSCEVDCDARLLNPGLLALILSVQAREWC